MPNPPAPQSRPGSVPEKKQVFDVLLLKKSVGAHVAAPEDFKRVRVEALSTLAARDVDEVIKAAAEEPGWTVQFVTPPGQLTEMEMLARSRQHQSSGPVDRRTVRAW
jgi:hypothetical protein